MAGTPAAVVFGLRMRGSAESSTMPSNIVRLNYRAATYACLVAGMTTSRAVLRSGDTEARADHLAVEAPLVLALGDQVLAVLMRTPGHDLELAAGWLRVESGVETTDELVTLRQCREEDTDRVHITLRPGVRPPRPRAFVTGSACGVCSADLLDLALLASAAPHSLGWTVTAETLLSLPDTMRAQQRAFDRTGGLHAAALADSAGRLLVVREDVGRHNAVDKVIGDRLLRDALPATDLLLVVSGRVSFEIVQKAVAAGVAGIVAVSAPSSLAVDLAREYGLLLAGMVRGRRLNLYAGAELVAS